LRGVLSKDLSIGELAIKSVNVYFLDPSISWNNCLRLEAV
jgi:hypothetical protein